MWLVVLFANRLINYIFGYTSEVTCKAFLPIQSIYGEVLIPIPFTSAVGALN